MDLLPEESHPSLSEAIKKLLEESSPGVLVPEIDEVEEEGGVQDTPSKPFVDLWSNMVKLVKEFVPSVPEVRTSPLNKRRTSSLVDREESMDSLPLHPDIISSLDSCMKEVLDGNERGESLSIGKFLKADRFFPKRVWSPSDKPRWYLPSVRVNKSLEELIPGIHDTSCPVKDGDWALMEAKLRELLIALSQLKWVLEAHSAFVDTVIPEASPDGVWRITDTFNLSLDYILTLMLDNLSTQLSNIVLRRRDLVLNQATNLRPQVVSELRGQSILQTELLQVDRETCERQAAQLERQVMVQSLKASLERSQTKPPFRGSLRRRQKARGASAKTGVFASYSSSSYRGGRGARGLFQSGVTTFSRGRGSRGRRGRGRGINPATGVKTSDSSASQSKKF